MSSPSTSRTTTVTRRIVVGADGRRKSVQVATKRPPHRTPADLKGHDADQHSHRRTAQQAAKLQHHDDRRALVRTIVKPEVVRSPPATPEFNVAIQYVYALERAKIGDSWPDLVAARIEHSEHLALAARALVKVQDLAFGKPDVTAKSCIISCTQAMTSLRNTIQRSGSSEDALLSVAILILFERTIDHAGHSMHFHLRGLGAILLGLPPTNGREDSQVISGILYGYWPLTFLNPCGHGTPSPFDSPVWVNLAPPTLKSPRPDIGRLRKYGNQLFLRLPRLIALVRQMQTEADPRVTDEALALAQELLLTQDDAAENEFLHHIKVVKTDNPEAVTIAPYSLCFDSLAEYEAGICYWQTRIFLLRLCWKLHAMHPALYLRLALPPKAQLQADISRFARNVLMSWQHTFTLGSFLATWLAIALLAVWGCITDFDVFPARSALTTPRVKDWILEHIHIIVPVGGRPSEAELNQVADLFAGGSINGAFAQVFKQL